MEIEFASDSDEPPQPWKQLASLRTKLSAALRVFPAFKALAKITSALLF